MLPSLVDGVLAGDRSTAWLPPVWFAALYSWTGWERPILPELAATGVRALLIVLLLVVPIYLAPAGMMARRSLESQSRHRAHPLSAWLRRVAAWLLASPAAAAVLWFTIASLARNRRHLLIVVSHAGLALASRGHAPGGRICD